jgi:hypothetical protein
MNDSQFNRGSWLAIAASISLLVLMVAVNAYRFTLPTDGWVYDGFSGGFTTDLLGLPSGIRTGDLPLAIDSLPIEKIANRPLFVPLAMPPGWRAGNQVAYTLDRAGQTITVAVPVTRWNQASGSRALLIWLRASWNDALIAIVYFLIGAFVFTRRPGSPAAQVLLFLGMVSFVMSFFFPQTIGDALDSIAYALVALLGYYIWAMLLFPTLFLLSLVFPHPKWPFRRHPRLTLAGLYLLAPFTLLIIGTFSLTSGAFAGFSLVAVYSLLTVASILHTFFQVRTDPIGRAQVKWVGLGVALVAGYRLVFNVIFLSSNFSFFTTEPWWTDLLDGLVNLSLPVTVGIAILRYRLFDIDLLIRRTLQYTLVTGLLALVYFGGITLLQAIFTSLSRQQSSLAIALSTLTIAALFNPVRKQVQVFIDRRFYRQKYDAEQALAEFAAAARNETDLGKLSSQMIGAVQDTLQPGTMSLWLRPSADRTGRKEP